MQSCVDYAITLQSGLGDIRFGRVHSLRLPSGWQQTGPKDRAPPPPPPPPSPCRPWPGAGLARDAAFRAHAARRPGARGGGGSPAASRRQEPTQAVLAAGDGQEEAAHQRPRREPPGPQQAPPECLFKGAGTAAWYRSFGLRVLKLAANSAAVDSGRCGIAISRPGPSPRLLADSAPGRRVTYGSFFTQNPGR